MSSCTIPVKEAPMPKKVEGKVKVLVRRLKEEFKPTHCMIRFDTEKQMWAELDSAFKPKRHFHYGIMSNVSFRSQPVIKHIAGGCGSRGHDETTYIGIAEGDLVSNTYGSDSVGYKNISFKEGAFAGENGEKLGTASKLRLLENRRSLYKD